MWPHTGKYVPHQDSRDPTFTYYTFTPRPLREGRLYKMDDELAALLADTHQKLGFLQGVMKYAPNRQTFSNLISLKESAFSVKIDYKSPTFGDVLGSVGTGKGNVEAITNVALAYEDAMSQRITNQSLDQICETALYGADAAKSIKIRRKQTFLHNVKTNLPTYSPTAPDELLPALGDIYSYLSGSPDDVIVKAAMAHYQFEMLHPYEIGNGIIGRILIPMILHKTLGEAISILCLSEFWYYNKNEYFDLLRSTQYSGGYERWIRHFVCAIGEVAERSAKLFEQYETIIAKDEAQLKTIMSSAKSVRLVYNHLKRFPVVNITSIEKEVDLSFNSISKALHTLQEAKIIQQEGRGGRNRIWKYVELDHLLTMHPIAQRAYHENKRCTGKTLR